MLRTQNVRMNYESELMGADCMPQFSWELESDHKQVLQTWFELQIAADQGFGELLFDSGKRTVRLSAHYVPEFDELQSLHKYYVRVRTGCTIDGKDEEESEWSSPVWFLTGLLNRNEFCASFISAETPQEENESAGTIVEGQFRVQKPVQTAYVVATALGLYHLYLNEHEVGKDVLTPGWTSYQKHLLYQIYEITDLLQEKNQIRGMLGAGWYKGAMGFEHTRSNYGNKTALFCQVHIFYQDGTKEVILSDESWRGSESPVVFSEIYDGEIYDAGINPVMDRPVTTVPVDVQILKVQGAARIREHECFRAEELIHTPQGDTVIDFGQNMSALVHIHAKGRPGDRIRLECFEVLDHDGNVYLDNLRRAKQQIIYTFGREEEIDYRPLFTFMGFRYIVIREFPGEIHPQAFTAHAIYSDMMETGHFESSNPLLEQLHHNIQWGLKSNFVDVPTDCPQRDERCGWTGDAQIFCRSATYLMNSYSFYEKWLRDVSADTMEDGSIPHVVPDLLYEKCENNWLLKNSTSGAAAWADVILINPWTLYLMYGDTQILETHFDKMKGWIDFMSSHAVNGIWNYGVQFGDWVALDAEEGSYFGATPVELTNTAFYAYSTDLFVKICRILKKTEIEQEYADLLAGIKKRYVETFMSQDGHMNARTQTAQIVSLYFHLVPKQWIGTVMGDLLELLREKEGHLVTGFIGTPYFCHALSQNGGLKEAYELLLKEDYPSWLYQVKMGATTVWEHWDGIRPDGTMWSPDMNSFNHYAYGAVLDWIYRVAAGIEVDEIHPGFDHFVIAPRPGGEITSLAVTYHSIHGAIQVMWERERVNSNGVQQFLTTLSCSIPANTTATICLKDSDLVIEGSHLVFRETGQKEWSTEAGSGSWTIQYVQNI